MRLGVHSPATSIRPASAADLAGIQKIFAHYVATSVATFEEKPPSLADWRARLDGLTDLGLPFLVARSAGDVAGYAYASPWRPRPAYRHTVEDSVYVDPRQAGRGIGRALLAALLTECARAGVRQVIAVIAASDSRAGAGTYSPDGDTSAASLALHRGLGFADAGRLAAVGRKHGRWVDTILLQRDLAEGDLTEGDLTAAAQV